MEKERKQQDEKKQISDSDTTNDNKRTSYENSYSHISQLSFLRSEIFILLNRKQLYTTVNKFLNWLLHDRIFTVFYRSLV